MRYTLLPPAPNSLETVRAVHAAVPTNPQPEGNCCANLAAAIDCSLETARTWLVFLQAIGMAKRDQSGISRVELALEPTTRQAAFRTRVFGVQEVLTVLADADGPLTPEEVRESLQSSMQRETRRRTGSAMKLLQSDGVRSLLEWARLFELVEDVDGRYRLATSTPTNRDQ